MTPWHVDDTTIARYRRGAVDEAAAASVEAHLVSCAACRRTVAAGFEPERLERIWDSVAAVVETPEQSIVERLLTRLGVREHVARLLVATPSLRASWLLAVAGALAFAAFAANGSRGDASLLFLTLAPLLPVAGVAAAYAPGVDPTYEVGIAAPMSGLRLLLLRSAAVLVTSSVIAGAAAIGMPPAGWGPVAWLVPSVALTLASLALGSVVAPVAATSLVGGSWIAVVLTATFRTPGQAVARDLVVFRPAGQIALALCALASLAIVVFRRDAYEVEAHP